MSKNGRTYPTHENDQKESKDCTRLFMNHEIPQLASQRVVEIRGGNPAE
jgi:hypothetical protein